MPVRSHVPGPGRAALPGRGSAPSGPRLSSSGWDGGGSAGWKGLLGRGIVFSALRRSISLKRDSRDCFQMRRLLASSRPGWMW